MKIGSLLVWAVLIPAILPALAQAEIYKWKDKNGITRYSDVPPPSDIKKESIGKKTPKAAIDPVAGPAENGSAPVTNVGGTATATPKDAATPSKEEAAVKRAKEAEAQKKADEVKQAELKYRQESCAAARTNLRAYSNGGRMMTTDENGERRYLGDDEVNKGKADAQQAVEKFCD
ncbi:MAG TPA: DUF4124 domain-containing protein [Methylotenera sp.]|jgi:hypothetical protein